ncbi:GNAT family N-acetyltransferase, partial [Bacillus thuringiensis]|nr:GNAT family N-acetyltransferase [Bacillus thuringiensis]
PWQRRGYAGHAAQLLVAELAERGVTALVAHVHPDHHASARIAERLGLTRTDVVVDGEIRWEGAPREDV